MDSTMKDDKAASDLLHLTQPNTDIGDKGTVESFSLTFFHLKTESPKNLFIHIFHCINANNVFRLKA
jgi:hypothetical protein